MHGTHVHDGEPRRLGGFVRLVAILLPALGAQPALAREEFAIGEPERIHECQVGKPEELPQVGQNPNCLMHPPREVPTSVHRARTGVEDHVVESLWLPVLIHAIERALDEHPGRNNNVGAQPGIVVPRTDS